MSETTGTRVQVPWEDALKRLRIIPDYDPGGDGGPRPCVHTFVDGGFGLFGAHWELTEIESLVQHHGCEESGPSATVRGHGLVILRPDHGALFLETMHSGEPL